MSVLKLCQLSNGKDDSWKQLYEAAFPANERHPVDSLRKSMADGTILLHETRNADGELLCFSIVNLMSDFCLLSYIATDQTKRSSGVGSKHLMRLLELLRADYPAYHAMFLEIESTMEEGLTPAEQSIRTRRLAFYERLGAKKTPKPYLMPTYGSTHGTDEPQEAELLWFEFRDSCVLDSALPRVIQEIFVRGYDVDANDPLVKLVMAQFGVVGSGSQNPCAVNVELPDDDATKRGDQVIEGKAPEDESVGRTESNGSDVSRPRRGDSGCKTCHRCNCIFCRRRCRRGLCAVRKANAGDVS